MSAAVHTAPDHAAMPAVPPRLITLPEQRRMEALLIQISADLGRLAAKFETISDAQRDLREELRNEVRMLRAEFSGLATRVAGDRASDLKAAEDLQFEKAALLRDQIKELKHLRDGGAPGKSDKPVSYRKGGRRKAKH